MYGCSVLKRRCIDNKQEVDGRAPSDLPILAQQINRFVEAKNELDSVEVYKVCNNLIKPS
ncbi:hypothetical protein FMH15_05120 [Vibrio alginolyticus]|nr:hypothetical protein [Vibrio alginolyticus]EGR0198428.1 hypothetical protein [Vibrio alginolyticus]EGR0266011.1 hypothetical protein [Vibrio alginolyticus]EGR0712499.1 hypothetical protein [Vibrio alginolyticus]EGR0713569.1 hypothetical protein [Vibrio alginolyticus]